MANRIKQEFELNVSQSEKNIQKLIQDAEKFERGIEKLGNSKSFSNLGLSATQLQKDIKGNSQAFEQFANDMSKGANTVKAQIRQLQNAMTNLAANGIDQASESYRAMQQELGRLKDIQADVAASSNVWANDNALLQGAVQGVGALTASYGAVNSAMQLFGVENENVNRAMQTTMAVTSLLNSVQTIQQALNKDSALMLTIIKPLREAYNAAINRSTAATIAATAAQKAFNLVAKVNPYVLIATTAIAAAAAVHTFSKNSAEAAIAERKLAKEAEETKKRIEEQRSVMANAAMQYTETAAKLQLLYNAYKKSNSEIERTEILKQAQAEFNKMGVACRNLKEAQKILINYTPKMIKALELQAQAAALSALAMDAYKKSFQMLLENGYDINTASILARANADFQGLFQKSLQLKAEGDSYLKGIGGGGSSSGGGRSSSSSSGGSSSKSSPVQKSSTGGGKEKPTYDKGSIADYENQLSDINKKLETQKLTQEEINVLTQKKADIEKKIKELKDAQTIKETDFSQFSLEGLNVNVGLQIEKQKEKEFKEELGKTIEEISKDLKPIDIRTVVSMSEIDDMQNKLNNLLGGDITKKAKEFKELWDFGDGTEKLALGLDFLGETANTLASGFSQMAQKSQEWATAARVAEQVTRSLAAAEAVLAAVTAIKEGAKMPFPANIVAIATASASVLAALMGAMSAFATGGIVGGTDYTGDKRVVRVNSGEMILNGRQQANLFNMINNGGLKSSGGGQVEFKIKGRELVGVLNNFNNKTRKVM